MNKKTKVHKQFDKEFGAFVKKKRIEKGWLQDDLAGAVDKDFQNISRLERGLITPTLYWCHKLAEAFELSLSDFFEEFEFKKKK